MKILGISSNYHDASAALIINGEVVASASEERFTLQKHDPSFPKFSIDFCLRKAKIESSDLDLVVYHEDPHSKSTRSLSSAFLKFPFSVGTFIKSAKDMISSGFWIKNEISKFLNIDPDKIVFLPHHLSHAAHAFLTSSFEEAAIMTIDAVGEWSATCLFQAKKESDGKFKIEPIEIVPFPHSLGLVYSAFTGFLGFKVNDGECSTMALASFGNPIYKDEIYKIIQKNENGLYQIDLSYFDFSTDSKLPLTEKFKNIFGEPRSYKSNLPFSSFSDEALLDISKDDQRFADIAASLQIVLEEVVISIARYLKTKCPSKNLCYAGGVALNCVANAKLLEAQVFDHVYIPPDPGDGGGAMGAALYASMIFDSAKPSKISPYLGEEYSTISLEEMLNHIDPEEWFRFSKIKTKQLKIENLSWRKIDDESELLDFVSKSIYENKIVGWIQGRFENGARALGNRSILIRPDSYEVAKRLSTKIKLRARFRPYACSMTLDAAKNLLVSGDQLQLEKWMQCSFKVKSESFEKIKAASHIDKTTRAQVCYESENPMFYRLLTNYKKYSGEAALLNTSLNESGFPMVASPYDALLFFARTDIDLMVINNFILEKKI